MNLPRFFCLGKPTLIFFTLLLIASAVLADTVTVAVSPYANYGSVSPNFNGKNLTDGKTYSLTASPKTGFKFTGWTGSTNTSKAKISFAAANGLAFTANFADTQKPTVIISAPAIKSTVSQPSVLAQGMTRDNDLVTGVFYQLNNALVPYDAGGFMSASTANGYKNWWADLSLETGTNLLLVFAVDRSGNQSSLSKVKITYAAAPNSVAGTTITVPDADNYFITFSAGTNGTFSEKTAVGSYHYLKTGSESGKLWLTYLAPPSAVGADTAALIFNGADSGVFSDAGDFTNSFTWTPATGLVLTNLNGAQLALTSVHGDNQTLLAFLDPPVVTGGLSPVATNNPLTVLLATPYPGNIGDRVAVTLSHLKDVNGNWVTNSPLTLSGSISGISNTNSSTNAVLVLFDTPLYLATHTDAFYPMANVPLTIFTCYYANYTSADSGVTANVPAPFAYTNFSVAGSLLKLKRNGTNEFIILTFDDPTNFSGTYYDEAYGIGVTVPVIDSGTFGIEALPVIFTQPANVNTTNGGMAIFTVVASGSPPLTYQWQLNGTNLTDAGSLTGSATASLTNSSVTVDDAGNYTVVVSNPFGVITNVTPAKLSVGVPPQFVGPAAAAITVASGTTTNFYVLAAGTLPLSYQWQLNQTNLPAIFPNYTGYTATNLVISLATTNNVGNYSVVIANSFGQITNYMGNLTVTP